MPLLHAEGGECGKRIAERRASQGRKSSCHQGAEEMIPTPELRTELRELIDEVIPEGGTEADTRFTDAQLDALIEKANTIEEAAAAAWERKGLRAMSERGGLEESQAGNERMKFVSIEAYRDHCFQMAAYFRGKVPGGGSRLFVYEAPKIEGVEA